jgi:hypothetical protein
MGCLWLRRVEAVGKPFADYGGPISIVRLWQGFARLSGTQARIACSSAPPPMIAITGFMFVGHNVEAHLGSDPLQRPVSPPPALPTRRA